MPIPNSNVYKEMEMKKYASFALVVGPLLTPYYFPGTTIPLENFFILFNILLLVCYNKFRPVYYMPKGYLLFFIYALFAPVLGLLFYRNFNSFISSYVSIILFTLSFLLFIPHLDYNLIKKYYKVCVLFVSTIFVIQELMFNLVGYRFSALIPFIPVRYSYVDTAEFIAKQMVAPRSQSVFLEPSHLAQFLLGYLAILLGENIQKNKLLSFSTLGLSLLLLLTWSGNGILLTLLLWIVFFVMIRMNPIKKYFVIVPLLLIVIFISLQYFSSTEKGEEVMARTEELDVEQEHLSSGAIRIYRGYFVFGAMPFVEKVTGVGSGTTGDVIEHSPFYFLFYDFERYLNNIQMLLVGYGLVGTLLFGLFLKDLIKCRNPIALMCVLLFIGMCFIEYFWGSVKMILYLAIPSMLCFNFMKAKNGKDYADIGHSS